MKKIFRRDRTKSSAVREPLDQTVTPDPLLDPYDEVMQYVDGSEP